MILVPTYPELSAKLQGIVAQLGERNGQYQGPQYSSIVVTLWCDASDYILRDFWISSVAPAGYVQPAPPQGLKTQGTITPGMTAAQCDSLAQTMIAAIKAHVGPVFVNV